MRVSFSWVIVCLGLLSDTRMPPVVPAVAAATHSAGETPAARARGAVPRATRGGGALAPLLAAGLTSVPLVDPAVTSAPAAAAVEEAVLVRIINTAAFSPPSPDPAGIAYIPSTGRLLMSDSEVEEMSIFAGANLYSMTLSGTLLATSDTLDFSDEPTGLALNTNNGHLFVSDDDANRIFEVAAGNDGKYGTSDDSVTSFSTSSFSGDSEDVGYDATHNTLYVSDGVGKEIFRITPGNNGLFDGMAPAGDDVVSHFDVAGFGAQDPEGVAFNPSSGTLFVLDYGSHLIIETTTAGAFIRSIGIGQSNLSHPEDLTFAPGSQDPGSWHAYITTRGVDNNSNPNENDGKVYEMSFSGLTSPGNGPPSVSAGPDQAVGIASGAALDGTVTDDGKPNPPGSVTTAWSKLSGPGTVSFGNASQVDTTASFSATGSYVLRLTANDGELVSSDDVAITVASGSFVSVTSQVGASADDAEEDPAGAVSLTSSDLELILEGTTPQVVGMRFPGVTIPKGATIQSAKIQFTVDEVTSGATSLTFRGQAIDNAPTFTTATANISSRTKTSASASWSPPAWSVVGEAGAAELSADLSPVIQEIVNRPGWSSGNALAIIVNGSGKRVAVAYNGSSAGAPRLLLQYGSSQAGNAAPVVNAGPDLAVALAAGASLDGTVTDDGLPAPPALTTAWSKVSGPGTVSFGNAAAVDTTASFSLAGAYVLRLSANDGALGASDDVNVTVTAANTPPVVSAGPDQTVEIALGAALNGTVTDDGLPAPPALATQWTKVSGPGTVGFGNAAAVDTTAAFSALGSYVLRLTANDGALAASDDVTITVVPNNQPPVVNAGPDLSVNKDDDILLDATVTDDGLPIPPGALTYAWTKVSGSGGVTFANPAAVDTIVSLHKAGSFVLRLTVSDGSASASDDVTVVVAPKNQAPAVYAGPDRQVGLGIAAVMDAIVSDDGLPDPPMQVVCTWMVISGPGVVTFDDPSDPGTSAGFSEPGSYLLSLSAFDGELTTTDEVVVVVDPINLAPVVDAGPDQAVDRTDGAALAGSVTDDGLPGAPLALTTSWSALSGPGRVFFADAQSPATTASFSEGGAYVLRLSASDGELESSDEVTITVAPDNEAPLVDAGTDQTVSFDLGATLDATVSDDGLPSPESPATAWSLVDGPGEVEFADATAVDTSASFGEPGVYVLRLSADDGDLSASDDVTITVTPGLFVDLGGAAPGVDGPPQLTAKGLLTPGAPLTVSLTHAPPGAPSFLWVSFASTPLPAFGGTLYPLPMAAQFLFFADAQGAFSVSAAWPPGVPAGTSIYFQFLLRDVTVPAGVTLSNAVTAATP